MEDIGAESGRFGVILVSGPQRSGTTIAAKMAAKDTGYEYIDEGQFDAGARATFSRIVNYRTGIVVHCPGMSYAIHEFANEDRLVVWMVRDVEDIYASEQRVGWWKNGPYRELRKYGYTDEGAKGYLEGGGRIARVKYEYWERVQRDKIPHWLEIEYESLCYHPMWVPKELRVNFRIKQTECHP